MRNSKGTDLDRKGDVGVGGLRGVGGRETKIRLCYMKKESNFNKGNFFKKIRYV